MGNLCTMATEEDGRIGLDFDYVIDNADNTDGYHYNGNDNYWDQQHSKNTGKRYQCDAELELGFPDNGEEYVSFPCLEDVIHEYENIPRGRRLGSQRPAGLRQVYHGNKDFFRPESMN